MQWYLAFSSDALRVLFRRFDIPRRLPCSFPSVTLPFTFEHFALRQKRPRLASSDTSRLFSLYLERFYLMSRSVLHEASGQISRSSRSILLHLEQRNQVDPAWHLEFPKGLNLIAGGKPTAPLDRIEN